MIKRAFDVTFALLVGLVLLLPIGLIALWVRLSSPGPALYWSDRVGRDNVIFRMPKFRSMRIETPAVATHLLTDTTVWLTPIGGFLRKTASTSCRSRWSRPSSRRCR